MEVCAYYLGLLGELEGGEISVNKCQTRMSDSGEQQYFLAILMEPEAEVVTQAVFDMPTEGTYELLCVASDQCINHPWNLDALC